MVATRRGGAATEKQQKLTVGKEEDASGAKVVEVTAGEKRKQDDKDQDQDHDQDQEREKSNGGGSKQQPEKEEEKHDERPAKAAKQETTSQDQGPQASGSDPQANSPADQSGPPSSAEKHLSGKDSGTIGSQQDTVQWTIMERGHVYFFYRPKVQSANEANAENGKPSADSIDSVQNFHLLMLPRSSDSETAPAKPTSDRPADAENKSEQTGEKARVAGIGARLIRLGKKRMPEPSAALDRGDQPGGIGGDSSEAIWAVVSDVATDFEQLKDGFKKREYSTKTSGQRVVQGARLAGRGWYTLSESLTEPPSSREVRLSYVLSHPTNPDDFGDVQKQLGLNPQSSCRLQMRNPTLPSTGAGAPPAGLDPSSRVEMSKSELKDTFGGSVEDDSSNATRYARPENINLLDRAGVELLMIKKKEQEEEDAMGLGETHRKAIEKLANDEGDKLSNDQVIQKELQLDAQENPPDALDGEWI